MGYFVYITRANDWMARSRVPIPESDWLTVVEGDPTLSINHTDYYECALVDGGTHRIHPVEWSGASDGNCFWYDDGAIECKNPSELWIAKMVELAATLNARVLGEANEEYGGNAA